MGKTHEALKFAEEEHRENILGPLREVRPEGVPAPASWVSSNIAMEPYEGLKTNLLSRYPDGSIKCILFNGTHHGGGCSTTAVNFAIAMAKDSELKVLMIDVNLRTPGLHDAFKIDAACGLTDLSGTNDEMQSLIKKVKPGDLYVLTCGGNLSIPLGLFESDRFNRFLEEVREKFDYIILDAPPVPRFPECRVLCAKADGVILVLEAGNVRRHVALRAKRALEEAGARLLGVVLNRRKYYIPEWIYNRL
jgi:capsular exopolysaccharide synthesis family protein